MSTHKTTLVTINKTSNTTVQKIEQRIAQLTRWMNNPVITFQMSDARAEEITSEYFDLLNQRKELTA